MMCYTYQIIIIIIIKIIITMMIVIIMMIISIITIKVAPITGKITEGEEEEEE